MSIPNDIIVRVAHADVAMQMAFPGSVRRWQSEENSGFPLQWQRFPGNSQLITVPAKHGVEIEGDCRQGISAPNGGLIHLHGDLASDITIDGHAEVIVAGNVTSHSTIKAAGFCHMFVGGDFSGTLIAEGSTKLWVDRDFVGVIKTGVPSTHLHVGHNYAGTVVPNTAAALLSLSVAGYAAEESLTAIADCGYTQFHAAIGSSNVSPGLYPKTDYHRQTPRGNSFSRWSVALEIGRNNPLNQSGWTSNQN